MRDQPNWSDLERVAHHVRLVAESGEDREEAILRAACDLVGAPYALFFRARLLPEAQLSLVSFHSHGLEAKQEALLLDYAAENGQDDPLIAPSLRLIQQSDGPMIQPRRQLISDRDFYAHAHVKNLRSEIDFDQCVNAVARLGGDRVCSLAIHRPWGERGLTDFELNLLQVFLKEVSSLVGWPALPAGGWLRTENGEVLDLRSLKSGSSFEETAEELGLTARERDVGEWLCRGATNKEIGWRLSISPQTVKLHVSAILRKTQATSRTEAAFRLRGGGVL